jgi:hypothetical protein
MILYMLYLWVSALYVRILGFCVPGMVAKQKKMKPMSWLHWIREFYF